MTSLTSDPTDSTDWRQKDDIIECNRQMLQRQIACDVYFLLGETHARQGAHKYMLVSRSHVFAAMFCGALNEGDKDIELPDVEPAAFAELLKYIYTGTADLDVNNVLPVLYTANKYDISGLARACVSYVEDRLDVENACALMEQAHLFEETEFRSRVLELILRKGEDVLQFDDVTELCHECLLSVLGADNLICKEEQVFDALDRWSGRSVRDEGWRRQTTTDASCWALLFTWLVCPLLSPQVFVDKVVTRSLLSEEEKVDVMRHFLVPAMRSVHFSSSPRKKEKHRRVHRYDYRNQLAWNNKSGENAIGFMTNHDIMVEGFTVYGTCRGGSHELTVEGKLLDSNDVLLTSITTRVITDNNVDIYDVLFDTPRRVTRNAWYTLTASIQGSHTYAGHSGRLSAFDGEVVFTFSDSEKSLTGTGVEQGQLPGILFTL